MGRGRDGPRHGGGAIAADTGLGFYEGEIIESDPGGRAPNPKAPEDLCCFYRVQPDATRVIDGRRGAPRGRRIRTTCAHRGKPEVASSGQPRARRARRERAPARARGRAPRPRRRARIDAGEPLALRLRLRVLDERRADPRARASTCSTTIDRPPRRRRGRRRARRGARARRPTSSRAGSGPTRRPTRARPTATAPLWPTMRAGRAVRSRRGAGVVVRDGALARLPLLPAAQRERAEEGLASSTCTRDSSDSSLFSRRAAHDVIAARFALSDCETALRLNNALAAVTIGDG